MIRFIYMTAMITLTICILVELRDIKEAIDYRIEAVR